MSETHRHTSTTPYVIGEVLFDTFPGGRRILGGAPFNVAWHLAGLNEDPLFLSAVGEDDPGREILRRMQEHGMSTQGVQFHQSFETGRVDVLNAETDPEYVFPKTSAWDCFKHPPTDLPNRPSILYQGSLFLRQECSRNASFELASKFSCPRFVDVNLRKPYYDAETVRRLVLGVDCLKVSEDELRLLAQWFEVEESTPPSAIARQLMKVASLGSIFVTMGARGAIWISKEGDLLQADAAPVDTFVDSVGAGDASASVAILGLIHNWPPALLLQRAMRFAAKICAIEGAIPKTKDFYAESIRNWN